MPGGEGERLVFGFFAARAGVSESIPFDLCVGPKHQPFKYAISLSVDFLPRIRFLSGNLPKASIVS